MPTCSSSDSSSSGAQHTHHDTALEFPPVAGPRSRGSPALPRCRSCPVLAFYVDVVVDVGVVNVAASVQGEYPALLWDRT